MNRKSAGTIEGGEEAYGVAAHRRGCSEGALRGEVVGVEEEDIGEARCSVGSARWCFKWTRGTVRRSSSGSEEFGLGEDRPGATLWRREEVSGGRRWRRVSSVLGENGKEGVGWLCCAQGRGEE